MRRQLPVSYLTALAGLVICSAGAVVLSAYRVERTGSPHLAFLTWNLFLAWLPLLFAAGLHAVNRRRAPGAILWLLALLWLLFFPNAPYILTDFIHLRRGHGAPLWFDFLLIGSFAGTGLLLAYASLYLVHEVVRERLGPAAGWMACLAALLLCSIGIYVGRFLRFNSWDAISQPGSLAHVLAGRVFDPTRDPMLVKVTFFFTVFLGLGYFVLVATGRALISLRSAKNVDVR